MSPAASPTVLVTGGAGYVGSHVCKALAARGFTPVVYDNLCRGNLWAVRWGPLETGDIGDRRRLAEVLVRYAPCAVIHLAAFAYIAESEAHPQLYYDNNITRATAMLETLLDHGVEQIIFSSSCATYGISETMPIVESLVPAPVNVYGTSKLIFEMILRDYTRQGRLRPCILRYFNAAGADPEGEIGEYHNPEPHIIPLLLAACATPGTPFSILGADYPTPDGSCIRDYIHVADLATAHVQALDYLLSGGAPVTLNLGTGQGLSVRELIGLAESVTGARIEARIQPRRAGDPPILVASAGAAEQILGWRPRWTDPRDLLASAWAWFTGPLPLLLSSSPLPRTGTGHDPAHRDYLRR